ncbi:MAG: GNAT family N-acetyltransferase [Verrucomicrobiota bacterium]
MHSHGTTLVDFHPLTRPRLLRSPVRSAPRLEVPAPCMEILDPLASPDEWDRECRAHPGTTVFHTAAWARVLAATYGHQPLYLRFRQENGSAALVPLMEVKSPVTGRRGVSLPFSDCCAPLLPDGITLASLRAPLEALAREHRWKYLELRGGAFSSPPATPLPASFHGHELDLTPGPDSLWNGVEGSVRRAVRKAQSHGLELRVAHDEAALRGYFELHTLTRQRHGLPPQPWAFFRQLHREKLIGPDAGFVVSASSQGRPVSASVFLRCGTAAVYKFGASDERAWDCRPNHLVMWEGIQHLIATGAHTLHFGRSSIGQEGLRRFKLSWGATESSISYLQYLPASNTWGAVIPKPDRPLVHALFRRLPLTVNRWAGRLLYPHLD